MAISKVADRGSGSDTATAASSFLVDMTSAGSITVGNHLIARVAMDNTDLRLRFEATAD